MALETIDKAPEFEIQEFIQCPLGCNGNPVLHIVNIVNPNARNHYFTVRCPVCGMRGPEAKTGDEAIRLWKSIQIREGRINGWRFVNRDDFPLIAGTPVKICTREEAIKRKNELWLSNLSDFINWQFPNPEMEYTLRESYGVNSFPLASVNIRENFCFFFAFMLKIKDVSKSDFNNSNGNSSIRKIVMKNR